MHILKNRFIFLILGALLAFFSCNTSGLDLGKEWLTESESTRVIITDTSTVNISSYQLDSVITSGGLSLYSGRFYDPDLGSTSVSSFFTLSQSRAVSDFETPNLNGNTGRYRYSMDSLYLVLHYDGNYYGDTTKPLTLNVHKLSQKLEPEFQNSYLYSHTVIDYDPEIIGSISFLPRPTKDDSIIIRLPDLLGEELMEMLYYEEDEISESDLFLQYFEGLSIVPSDDSECIIGFQVNDSSFYMRLEYTIHKEGPYSEKYVYFPINTGNYYYNHIDFDRSGTFLDGIGPGNYEIPSTETDNRSFIQGLSGLYTKISFPHLNEIMGYGSAVEVISAELYIYPLWKSYGDGTYTPLPKEIVMYISDINDVTTGAISDNNAETQVAKIETVQQMQWDNYYVFDISDFIESQIGAAAFDVRNLQLIVDDYGFNLHNLKIPDQTHGEYSVKLELKIGVYDY